MAEYAGIIKVVISLMFGIGLFLIYYGFNRWLQKRRTEKERGKK